MLSVKTRNILNAWSWSSAPTGGAKFRRVGAFVDELEDSCYWRKGKKGKGRELIRKVISVITESSPKKLVVIIGHSRKFIFILSNMICILLETTAIIYSIIFISLVEDIQQFVTPLLAFPRLRSPCCLHCCTIISVQLNNQYN